MRFLGIDYGKKRVGLALSDEERTLAFPHKTLSNNRKLVEEISDICQREEVSLVVVGKSQMFSGKDNPIMKDIEFFIKKFSEVTKVPVYLEAEFFTTQEAYKIQKDNKNADASAAALILQRFLEKHNFKGVET